MKNKEGNICTPLNMNNIYSSGRDREGGLVQHKTKLMILHKGPYQSDARGFV